MGQFQFAVPADSISLLAQSKWRDAYICGVEGVPWECSNSVQGGLLTIRRPLQASGKLHLSLPIKGFGYRLLSTCALASDQPPYHLLLELARGSCQRLRDQSSIWQRAGLQTSDRFGELLQRGTSHLLDAMQVKQDAAACSQHALLAINTLESAISDLGESFALQSIAFRKHRESQLGTLLASSVIPPSPTGSMLVDRFDSAFNSAAVRLNWGLIEREAGKYEHQPGDQTIQWCSDRGMRVIAGPLIDFRRQMLPPWLYLIEDDFDGLVRSVTEYVERVVTRYQNSVHLWNCASSLNTLRGLDLDDEQIMRLAVAILQTVRRCAPNTPAVFSFDQPFGEYLARRPNGISPLHFADALARSGLGLAGIGLDVRLNYAQHSTATRSAMDFGGMIDRWATLGLPLLVQLAIPGDVGADPHSIIQNDANVSGQNKPELAAAQLQTAGPILRTLLAKQLVHGVVWDGWSDAEPHVEPHSGVIDPVGTVRPVLELFEHLRSEFLS